MIPFNKFDCDKGDVLKSQDWMPLELPSISYHYSLEFMLKSQSKTYIEMITHKKGHDYWSLGTKKDNFPFESHKKEE